MKRMFKLPDFLVHCVVAGLGVASSVLCWAAPSGSSSGATLVVPQGSAFVVKANEVSKELLQRSCMQGLEKQLYPRYLKILSIDARAIDEENYSCLVKGQLDDGPEALYSTRFTQKRIASVDAQYVEGGNIKTGTVTMSRTDVGQAKETASLALAGMFFDIQMSSIAPHKVVFDAKIADGPSSCKVTMVDEGQGDVPVWRVTDLQCGRSKRRQ